MKYEDFEFKIPTESADYKEASCFVISSIEEIIKECMPTSKQKIYRY